MWVRVLGDEGVCTWCRTGYLMMRESVPGVKQGT